MTGIPYERPVTSLSNTKPLLCVIKRWGQEDVMTDDGIRWCNLWENNRPCEEWSLLQLERQWCCYLAGIKTELMSEKNSQGIIYFSGSLRISQLLLMYSRSGSWSERRAITELGLFHKACPAKKVWVRNSFLKVSRQETPLILLQPFLIG